jgi:hypothetical protein
VAMSDCLCTRTRGPVLLCPPALDAKKKKGGLRVRA